MLDKDLIQEILNSNAKFEQVSNLVLTNPARLLVEQMDFSESHHLYELLSECLKSCELESTFPMSITAFRLYSCIRNLEGFKDLDLLNDSKDCISRFPFLAKHTCEDDIFTMAKIFVETARIKYNTLSDEWYEALPFVLATIGQAYQKTVKTSEQLYSFEEHVLKCILKHAETIQEQTIQTLLTCVLENPYLSSVPTSQILG